MEMDRGECSRNAAHCNSQGHRPWSTAYYTFSFKPQRGALESAPLGLEKRKDQV